MVCARTGTQAPPEGKSWAPWFSNFVPWFYNGVRGQPITPHSLDDKVYIGHMDMGFTDNRYVLEEQILKVRGTNYVDKDAKFAEAPVDLLPDSSSDEKNHQNHGTATMSVVIGTDDIPGVAQQVIYVPYRVSESPVLFQGNLFNLAAAITHFAKLAEENTHHDLRANEWRNKGPHIVSMSMGTLGMNIPHTASSKVVEMFKLYSEQFGIIFVAAGGQYPGAKGDPDLESRCNDTIIAFPASDPNVIAVGAHDQNGKPNTTGFYNLPDRFGTAFVDLLAPGVDVHVARSYSDFDPSDLLQRKTGIDKEASGSSYATQFTAAAAALWILKHGKEPLIARYGLGGIPKAFKTCLLKSCDPPGGNPADFLRRRMYGSGLLNVECLLQEPLPEATP